jgi:hypothetical protein
VALAPEWEVPVLGLAVSVLGPAASVPVQASVQASVPGQGWAERGLVVAGARAMARVRPRRSAAPVRTKRRLPV